MLAACLAGVLASGCSTLGKLHTQAGVVVGKNFGDEPFDFQDTQAVAELGYVPGGLHSSAPRWSFGGTAYALLDDPIRPGIKVMARRRINRTLSLDISAGPMITYDSSGLFNGFTGGVTLTASFLTLRSEFVSWPFEGWEELHHDSGGMPTYLEHHPGGHEQVWYNGVAVNGAASWWAAAIAATLILIAGANGAFD